MNDACSLSGSAVLMPFALLALAAVVTAGALLANWAFAFPRDNNRSS
jgi:hypothetical protein